MTPRLLQALVAANADARCATDLLLYFTRHPHVYVPIDRLAALVGYAETRVQSSIDALIQGGAIVQRRHPCLDAAMYRVSSPLYPPGVTPRQFIRRWKRQIDLVRTARARCRRYGSIAAAVDERVRRAAELLARMSPPRGGRGEGVAIRET
jgi:hypothetical protein